MADSPTRVITGKCRLSYVHVFEPFSVKDDQAKKYSCVLLIPKTDKKTLDAIKKAQQAALEDGKNKVFNGKVPKAWKSTLHDGDEEADLERNPEYKGHMYVTVSSSTRPGVVDSELNPITSSTEVYSGCYARVSINAFAFNVQGNRGVGFGLNNLQKLGDGESFGGYTRAEEDFGVVDDDEGLI